MRDSACSFRTSSTSTVSCVRWSPRPASWCSIQDIVDQWKADDPEGFAQIYESTWDDGMWNGELVGMANTASMEEVYFRTDWLAEGGVTGAPETWDDVLDFARAIKKETGRRSLRLVGAARERRKPHVLVHERDGRGV
jgi:ABC-type glycerol-3-phosphate transport system substrate-binding protein